MINNEQNTPVSQSLLSICAPDPSGGRGEDFVLSGQERERERERERLQNRDLQNIFFDNMELH